ncbi:MAG: hypothetical protein ACRCTA_00730 [Bacilli bacterium]
MIKDETKICKYRTLLKTHERYSINTKERLATKGQTLIMLLVITPTLYFINRAEMIGVTKI